MSNGKLPPLKSITPPQVAVGHRVECPFGLPRRRTPPGAQHPLVESNVSDDLYAGKDIANDAMQLAAPPGGKNGMLSKPHAEAAWAGESSGGARDNVVSIFQTSIDAMTTQTDSRRFTAALDLIGLAREHLVEGSPYVEEVFAAAAWLLKAAHEEQHLGDRNLAAKIMIHTNSLLPALFPPAYETAQLLRKIIQEQEDDVVLFMQAYTDLVHCFPDDHMEIVEGLVVFEGVATMGRNEEVRAAARDAYQILARVRDPSFYKRPAP